MNTKVIIAIVVAVLLLGGGAFFLSQNNATTPTTSTPEVTSTQEQMTEAMSPTAAVEGDSTTSGNVKEVTVDGSNFKFEPTEIRVKKGDTVKVMFKNTGGFHDFVIDEFNVKTAQIQGGAEEAVEFVADQVGEFEYYCSVGNHRQMGMKGTLIVEE